MTQVETRDTIDVAEALDRIDEAPFAIRLGTPHGAVFIRRVPGDGRPGDKRFKANVHVPVVEDRVDVDDVEGGTVTEAIKGADTARIVPIEKSPWSQADGGFEE